MENKVSKLQNKISKLERKTFELEKNLLSQKVNYLSTMTFVIAYLFFQLRPEWAIFGKIFSSMEMTVISFSVIFLFFLPDTIKLTKIYIRDFMFKRG